MERKKITCPLKYIATSCNNRVAIESGKLKITYKTLDLLADQIADRLSPFSGKKIGVFTNDQTRLIILLFACLRKNICPIFYNTWWPKLQVIKSLEDCGCSLFLNEGIEFNDLNIPQSSTERLFENRKEVNSAGYIEESASIILNTSSSTSFAKACRLNIKMLLISAKTVSKAVELDQNSKILLSLPLFHIAGISLVLRSIIHGATLCLPYSELEKDLIQYEITHVSMVPTQVYRMLLAPKKELKKIALTLKCLLIGGGPISQSLLEDAKKHNLPVYVTYGMTESCSSVLIKKDPTIIDGKVFLGMPLNHMQIALSEDKQILLKGASLFDGYLSENGLILPLENKGWFSTKDLAEYCPKKGFSILGRADHQFISGGENIQPEQIERALMTLEEVLEAVVVPVKDQEYGYRPVAFIKATKKLDKLPQKLKEMLPKFKIPIHFFDLNELDFSQIKRKRKDLITMAEEKISKKKSP